MCLLSLLVHFGARHCMTPEVADFCRTPGLLLDLMHHIASTSELSASKDSFNIWKYIHEWTWSPELLKLQLEICSTSFWFSRRLSCTLIVSKSNSYVAAFIDSAQGEHWSQFDSKADLFCVGLAGTLVIWTRQAPWLTARLELRFLAQRRNGFGSSSVALIPNKICWLPVPPILPRIMFSSLMTSANTCFQQLGKNLVDAGESRKVTECIWCATQFMSKSPGCWLENTPSRTNAWCLVW